MSDLSQDTINTVIQAVLEKLRDRSDTAVDKLTELERRVTALESSD